MSTDCQFKKKVAVMEQEEREFDLKHSNIRHKVLILSGKGGVGKSTIAVNTAVYLALNGFRTGLLDIDIHGPSVPTMLGVPNAINLDSGEGINPIEIEELNDLKIMSIGFFLPQQDSPVIWRGPRKTGMIKEFVENVVWGELDYLIVDCPPGTGDEPLSAIQLIKDSDGAIIVTTPQKLSAVDVSKSINFCRQLQLPVLGLVENMSELFCPNCQQPINVFPKGGGEELATRYKIPFIGKVPIDIEFGKSGDSGVSYVSRFRETNKIRIFSKIFDILPKSVEKNQSNKLLK